MLLIPHYPRITEDLSPVSDLYPVLEFCSTNRNLADASFHAAFSRRFPALQKLLLPTQDDISADVDSWAADCNAVIQNQKTFTSLPDQFVVPKGEYNKRRRYRP